MEAHQPRFPSTVAPVCAAAGAQALGALRPPGAAEEEAPACRALHHQRYETTRLDRQQSDGL